MICRNVVIDESEEFLENLILQRTDEIHALGGGAALKAWFETGERKQLSRYLDQQNLTATFFSMVLENIENEARSIINELPTDVQEIKRFSSIGCGNAILEMFLCCYFQNLSHLDLIDIEFSPGRHTHGFVKEGSGYASLKQAKDFVLKNAKNVTVKTINPKFERLENFSSDLILSSLSMGFHYPCDEYSDFIVASCSDVGSLMLDKRREVIDEGFQRILNSFEIVSTIPASKHDRVFLTRHRN